MSETEIYGLILAGGKSKRMGQDKSRISYKGIEHREWMYNLLNLFLDQVFISVKSFDPEIKGIPQIADLMNDYGPIVAILSAFHNHPDKAWLILACDLPFVNKKTVEHLLAQRDPCKMASSLKSPKKGFSEPLIAIWEPASYPVLLNQYKSGFKCPRRILQSIDHKAITINDDSQLFNANTPGEKEWAFKNLNQ